MVAVVQGRRSEEQEVDPAQVDKDVHRLHKVQWELQET